MVGKSDNRLRLRPEGLKPKSWLPAVVLKVPAAWAQEDFRPKCSTTGCYERAHYGLRSKKIKRSKNAASRNFCPGCAARLPTTLQPRAVTFFLGGF